MGAEVAARGTAISEICRGLVQGFSRIQGFLCRLASGAAFASRFGEGFRGRDRTQDIKQRSIGGNLQVEVDGAVHQDSAHAKHAGQSHSPAHFAWPVSDFL